MSPPFPLGSNLDPRVSPIRRTVGTQIPMLLAMGSQVNTPANHVAYSFDGGLTFTQGVAPDPGSGGWFGAAYSESLGKAIMVSAGGTVVESTDGITWTAVAGEDLNDSNWQAGVVRNADDSLFVCAGIGGTAGLRVATSPTGQTWTLRTTPSVAAEGAAFGTRIVVMDDGRIFTLAGASTTRSFIVSDDGGITWAYTRAAGTAIDTQDFALRRALGYIHLAGFTNANAGDTWFTTDEGANLTRVLRDALNDPPNGTACAIDPTRGHFYVATAAAGIWRINCNEPNNPVNNNWTQVYAAGNVGGGSRGGYIEELDTIIFADSTGGFRTHRNDLSVGSWSTTTHAVLPSTARVRLDFLPFQP